MTGWQWHQLDHMQIICTSVQTDNHTSISPRVHSLRSLPHKVVVSENQQERTLFPWWVQWWMMNGWGQATGWTQCFVFPSVLWHCWLGDRKDIRPVKTWATFPQTSEERTPMEVDWLSCGFTSHSKQNSFQRCSPSQSLGFVWKNKT